MDIIRIYSDGDGQSHFDHVPIELVTVDDTPPAPPFEVGSSSTSATDALGARRA